MAAVACAECCAVCIDTTTDRAYAVFVRDSKECMLWVKLQQSSSKCDVKRELIEDAKTEQSITKWPRRKG